ncbi:hypothetical protein QYE76_047914 [Lolium multiflorum]|uniref:DUF4283 domain-containing protein n=1 Tax=Lolium multiflorum TaxID=4521 RepID=A0AAD8TR83_LOLMU|nr:hypothetical protein QYE76_047914 [Lolium multiflorum]
MCASLSKVSEPFWAGFGVDGRVFTCCEVPEEELLPPAPNAAMVILEEGDLSAGGGRAQGPCGGGLGVEVRKINQTDFAMFFPSKESLRMAIRGGGLTLPTSKLHIIVTSNAGDPAAVEQLEDCWIKLFDVPPPYRQAVCILLATRELGRPIAVDESSLDSPLDPVRVLIGCRVPVQLPPFFILFVNSQGFMVRIVREGGEREEHSDPPPPPQRKLSDERDEELEESEGEGWNGRRGKHKKVLSLTKGKGGSTSVPQRKSVPVYAAQEKPGDNGPRLPTTAFSQYGSNLTEGEDIFPVLAEILQPAKAQPEPSGKGPGEGRVESRRIEEKELEGVLFAEGAVVPELAAPISRVPRSKASPVAAARTSARGAGSSSIPILEKAIQRAAEKTPGPECHDLRSEHVIDS